MKIARNDRVLLAWVLYFSVLFSAFACSIGHGQITGLQLSGVDGAYCSALGNAGSGFDLDGSGVPLINPNGGFGCSMCSTFVALALAAFFGLLGLFMAGRQLTIKPRRLFGSPVRYLWPSANPRASPLFA